MTVKKYLFTSECVTEGHPDKICDQISDAILDACLREDPDSRVACEVAIKNHNIFILGEITTNTIVDYQAVVKSVLKNIGYHPEDYNITLSIDKQSHEIAKGIENNNSELGAGDQGLMFGYATNETDELMPLSHVLATKICQQLSKLRKNGTCPWLRPDGKSQITIEYKEMNGITVPIRVHTIVISVHHDKTIKNIRQLEDRIQKYIISPVIPKKYLDEKTVYHINPSGLWTVGGSISDAGLTGRKIIVDTYGGWGAHGGGAFSGKDPTKVDRSGAYMARWIAKSLVANRLCSRVLVQISYAIGIPYPISIYINTYGTIKRNYTENDLIKIVNDNFNLSPRQIIKELKLKRPIYFKTASYGHFGRSDKDFHWETPKKLKL